MDDDVIQPAAREPMICDNCGKTGHTLRRCMGPLTRDGTIPGCPLCDTVDHELRTCPNLHNWTRRQAWNSAVKLRQGRPSFNIPWLLWELAPNFEMFLTAATDGKLPQSGVFADGRYREFGIQNYDHVVRDPTWTTLMRPWHSGWMQPQAWHRNFGNFSMRPGESPLLVQQTFGEKGPTTLPRKFALQNEASLNVRPGSVDPHDSISQVGTVGGSSRVGKRGGGSRGGNRGGGSRGGNRGGGSHVRKRGGYHGEYRGGYRGGAQSGSMSQAPVFHLPPQAPVSYGPPMQAGGQVGYFPQQTPVSYGPPMQAGGQVGYFLQQTPVSYGPPMQAGGQVGGFPQQTPVSYGDSMQAGSQFDHHPQQALVLYGNPTQAGSQVGFSPPQASVQSGAPGPGLNTVFSNHLVMAMERVIEKQMYEANIAVYNKPSSSLSQSYRDRDDGSSHQGNSSHQHRRSQSPRGGGSAWGGGGRN
ncbi:hypothetical protein HYFRA_00002560 [Hymenoscyphus fraxineus]|uniref:CCHC-type domain-containing protein n=1 Tax=Hymenoscyphus fraxineus TaxID=746836 RepID=A0A9N9LB64_9HELO|nr:hypothetical protein HYFRA_00002560 [Hymenoscyphus fraxineus]